MTQVVQTSQAAVTVTPSFAASVSTVVAIAQPLRRGLIIFNNSANSAYVNFGLTASSATCSVIIPTFNQWIWVLPDVIYTGPIAMIRNAGTGNVIVTEFLAVPNANFFG